MKIKYITYITPLLKKPDLDLAENKSYIPADLDLESIGAVKDAGEIRRAPITRLPRRCRPNA